MNTHIAKILVETGVVQTNFSEPFTWTSGIQSPIYCDCRELISLPDARQQVIDAWVDIIRTMDNQPDIIAGTATAGIPWAAWVAQALGKPMIYVRSKPKGHGGGKMVEGRVPAGANIVVIEDALSTGGSVVRTVDALRRECSATVTDVLAIFRWSLPVEANNMKDIGVQAHVLADFNSITNALNLPTADQQQLETFHASLI